MWKWLCLVLVATPAFAGPKKLVDASVTFKRTIEDTSTETDSTNTACVRTKKAATTFTEQAQVVAAKVPLTGNNFTIPNATEASLSGQAHYDYKSETHSASCDGKSDFTGSAQGDADAKDISVIGDETSVQVSPRFKDAKGQGTVIDAPKNGPTVKQDGAKLAESGAAMFAGSMGAANLFTAEQMAVLAKAAPSFVDVAKLLAQDKPVVVQLTNGNIDITYTNSQTLDMTKYDQPAPSGVKKTGTRKVVTEVSIHLTPSK